jgi:hypothetical protein
MSKIDSMSAAVCQVIDEYPAEHEFYGNQLKDDVVQIYPKAVNMYVDTVLKMARRHRRQSYVCIARNDSLYKKVVIILISVQIKEPEPEQKAPVIGHSNAGFTQGFLFSFLLFAMVFSCCYVKIGEPVSEWIVEIVKISGNFRNFFEKTLSLHEFRHDTFDIPERVNTRKPLKAVSKWYSLETKGAIYDDYGRKTQRAS